MSNKSNLDGVIQVGEFVGAIYACLNVWTKLENTQKLVEAIKEENLDNNKEFIIRDARLFDISKADWFVDNSCPKDRGSAFGGFRLYKNPTANRRIVSGCRFVIMDTELSNGNRDYTAMLILDSRSYKSTRNSYKTVHYGHMAYGFQKFSDIPTGARVFRTVGFAHSSETKYASFQHTIAKYRNKPQQYLFDNGIRLLETEGGPDGGLEQGMAVSHRGMGGRYVRWNCN